MRLIDANDFIEKMHELYEQAKWGKREIHFSLADLECNVDMMPSIDAVQVVRCEQCKWWDKEDVQPDGRRRCELLDNIRFEPEFWCAYGERKEE